MVYVLVRHTVEDHDRWRSVFDEDAVNRERAGSRGARVFRNRANPNELVLLFDYADLAKLEAFASSPELREAMGHAGVIGAPDITFLDLVDRPEV